MNWNYNPEQYNEKNFKPIDEGDYRVRISKAEYKAYASGKACYEVTLDVSGHNNKLWYHIWLDPFDERKTNQKLGEFFHSFGIGGGEYQSFDAWVGKMGAVRVRHAEYEGRAMARVVFCLNQTQQEQLPTWEDKPSAMGNGSAIYDSINTSRTCYAGAKITTGYPARAFNGFDF